MTPLRILSKSSKNMRSLILRSDTIRIRRCNTASPSFCRQLADNMPDAVHSGATLRLRCRWSLPAARNCVALRLGAFSVSAESFVANARQVLLCQYLAFVDRTSFGSAVCKARWKRLSLTKPVLFLSKSRKKFLRMTPRSRCAFLR